MEYLKSYIQGYLLSNLEKVTDKYLRLMKNYYPCYLENSNFNEEELYFHYEEQLSNFFQNIMEDCVMQDLDQLLSEWNNDRLALCQDYKIPDDLIIRYRILKDTLIFFVSRFTKDFRMINRIITELNDLDESIQGMIMKKFTRENRKGVQILKQVE